jgi:uncharacterized protein YggT (Ycf19 family)
MRTLFYIAINVLIIALFIYSKLTPYKNRLSSRYVGIFAFFDKIFSPLLNLLRQFAKPAQAGNGIAVDMSQIVLLIILLFLLRLL